MVPKLRRRWEVVETSSLGGCSRPFGQRATGARGVLLVLCTARNVSGLRRGLCADVLIACGCAVTRPCTATTMSERLAFRCPVAQSASRSRHPVAAADAGCAVRSRQRGCLPICVRSCCAWIWGRRHDAALNRPVRHQVRDPRRVLPVALVARNVPAAGLGQLIVGPAPPGGEL